MENFVKASNHCPHNITQVQTDMINLSTFSFPKEQHSRITNDEEKQHNTGGNTVNRFHCSNVFLSK